MDENPDHHAPTTVDVVVIGGGAAGLSAALTLGRARRRTLLVDAGEQRNMPAEGIHGFLTRDGMSPAEFVTAGRAEVEKYGATVVRAEVIAVARAADGFAVTINDGRTITARRLIVTTGLVDELPDVPGLRERWGRDVVHCPYCHGYEIRDHAIGVLAAGPMAVHQAKLFRQWSPDVVLFTHTVELDPADREELIARDIRIVDETVVGLQIDDDHLTGVRLADGTVVARQAVAVATRMVSRSAVLTDLGLDPVPHPMGAAVGELIPTVDPTGRTIVPGLWVAGNVTDLTAQVVSAAAQGVLAAAAVNADLVDAGHYSSTV